MSNIKQFEKVVTEAGAVAMRVIRGPDGSERLIIQTSGGLITREVPLQGDLGEDIQAAATSAKEIVASAKLLTSPPARNLTSPSARRP
jgi:4-hydroxyphenylpyruvate dioxygenase-like putative hemolysin